MNKILKEKIMEAFSSVLPITVIVLIASVVLTPIPSGTVLMFLAGAALLVVGMGFFTLGADMAMMPLGEGIGIQLTKSSKLGLILIVSFVMGVTITIAEPDLHVLAKKVSSSIPFWYMILTVAAGVGLFLVISVIRPLLKIRLSTLLIIFYIITFGVAYFAPNTFIPVAFDSGGVTTGPITVPFILAMGIGVVSIRSDKDSQDDSFGLVALCSVGPILAVLLMGIFYNPDSVEIETYVTYDAANSRDVVRNFAVELPVFFKEIFIALSAIVIFFIIFQFFSRRFHRHQIGRIIIGFLYTLIGLELFLTGVNVGFIPVGELLGSQLASTSYNWILIPLGVLIGYFIVAAEPAVHVLNKQVEEISSGAITVKMMNRGLSVGMAGALAITMARILLHIPIMYILIPGYIIALTLTFFVPKIFTGIAFDSGGVCSGPMCTTFLLPFAMGACEGVKGNLMVEAFGIVAMVAMTPLIVIQLMGLIYKLRTREAADMTKQQTEVITAANININWGKITVFGENTDRGDA
ncbi:MAG: DUF1538 domain-containing protein [Treponema sp.]|jgi:hypothetical protein|nr:DUF1538 domain-containing protein [Treponema sp.]